jgi:hypothetical protein
MKIIKQGIIFSLVLLGFVSTKEQLTAKNESKLINVNKFKIKKSTLSAKPSIPTPSLWKPSLTVSPITKNIN